MKIPQLFELVYTGKLISEQSKTIIHQHHYSGTVRSQKQVHVFELTKGGVTVGVAIFGQPMARLEASKTLELRRFCLVPDLPKNTASYFLGKCLRWIRQNDKSIERIVTFADPNHEHVGTIYKATNFTFVGEEKTDNPRIVKVGERTVHLRQFYQKRDGEYTTNALMLQLAVQEGLAEIVKQKRKLKYEMRLTA